MRRRVTGFTMARNTNISVIADAAVRARVLELVRAGGLMDEVAPAVGTTRQAIHRYARTHPEFKAALAAARANATQTASTIETAVGGPGAGGRVVADAARGRTVRDIATSQARAVLLAEAGDLPPERPPTIIEGRPDTLPRVLSDPTEENVVDLCWALANDPDVHPVLQKAGLDWCAKRTIGIRIAEQLKELEIAIRRKQELAEAETAESTDDDDDLIIGIPLNGSEAPGRGPNTSSPVVDAEVVS